MISGDAFDKAALSGFRGVEFMFPYDNDIEVLKRSSGIIIWNIRYIIYRLATGRHSERGSTCILGAEEFRDGVTAAIAMHVR